MAGPKNAPGRAAQPSICPSTFQWTGMRAGSRGSSASVTANDRAHTPQMAHSVLLLCFIAVSLCKTGHPCKHVL